MVDIQSPATQGTGAAGLMARLRTGGRAIGTPASVLSFIVITVLVATPVVLVIYGSLLTDSPGSPDAAFTFANWARVYGTGFYQSAFVNTILLSTVTALLSVLIGGVLAWIVARTDAPGRRVLALLFVVPLMLSHLISTLAWIALAAPNAGFINMLFRAAFGVKTIFDVYSFWGIVLVMALHYAAFAFIAILAALQSIDSSLEEASYMLGANPLRTAWNMTMPLIWPSLAAAFLMTFIMSAENFSVPTLLGAPTGFQTLTTRIYLDLTVEPAQPNVAAAGGTMLLWIALIGTLWQRRILKNANRFVTISGKGGRRQVTPLGRWRYLATAVLLFYLFISVILPYATLILGSFLTFLTPRISLKTLTLDNYKQIFSSDTLGVLQNSLLYSVLGGLGLSLLYVVIGYFIKTSKSLSATMTEYVTMVPTAVPALVLAVGVLWMFVGLPLPIYGTAAILIIGYFIRFIGYGVRQARVAFVQLSGDLNEAARVAGAGQIRSFFDISLPLLRPALMSLWTLMFINLFTEISATILLYSAQTKTLPVILWNFMASGNQTRAFAVAVVQASIIFAILLFTDRRFGTLRNTIGQD
jgi:iron(III) transport system permease protein